MHMEHLSDGTTVGLVFVSIMNSHFMESLLFFRIKHLYCCGIIKTKISAVVTFLLVSMINW